MSKYFNVLSMPVDIRCLAPYGLDVEDVFTVRDLLATMNHVLFLTLERLETVTGYIGPEVCQLDITQLCTMREKIRSDDVLMFQLKPAIEAAGEAIDWYEEDERLKKQFDGALTRVCNKYPVMIHVIHNSRPTEVEFQRARHSCFTQVTADHVPRRSSRVRRQTEFYYF
jgi:hypothetical protein